MTAVTGAAPMAEFSRRLRAASPTLIGMSGGLEAGAKRLPFFREKFRDSSG